MAVEVQSPRVQDDVLHSIHMDYVKNVSGARCTATEKELIISHPDVHRHSWGETIQSLFFKS